jgi:hypothetical protein
MSSLPVGSVFQSLMLSALTLVVEVVFVKPSPLFGDAVQYSEMARSPLALSGLEGYARGMYGYRILTPLLVHMLPFGVDQGFRLVTSVSLLLSSLVLYAFLMRCCRLSHRTAMLGQFLFLTNITTAYNIAIFRLVDPLSYFFLILGLYFVYTGRDLPFAAMMVIGVLNKETELMLAPVYYLVKRRKRLDLPRAYRTLMLSLPALVVFCSIHLLLSGSIIDPAVSLSHMLENLASSWKTHAVWSLGLFAFSWSFLWMLAVLGYLRCPRNVGAKRLMCLIPFVLPWAAIADISRMLAYAFPVTVSYSSYELSRRSRTSYGLWASVTAVVAQTILQALLIAYVLNIYPYASEVHRLFGV